MLLHVAPDQAGIRTIDETHVHGRQTLNATLEPGSAAIPSTAAQLINSIPAALRADRGIYAPGDLPPRGPWLGRAAPI